MADDAFIHLQTDGARADIALRGAELTRWRIGDRELLWQPDPAIWERTSPLLFPVVGWCRDQTISVEGKHYPMPVHGFAAASVFEIEQQEPAKAVLSLRADDETRLHYPYNFVLRVEYEVSADSVAVRLTVGNEGARTLYYACGLHPGFAMPFAGGELADYHIAFAEAERPKVPVISQAGLFCSKSRAIPLFGKTISLNRELFANEALCFVKAKSDWLALVRPGHGRVTMSVDNFPHLAVWSRPDAPFVSLEAWTGYGDTEDFTGDIAAKPGMRALPAGGTSGASAVLSYTPDS